MKIRTRAACLSAAVAAVSFGFRAEAEDLIWDVNSAAAGAQDGTGIWDLSTPTWLTTGGTNVAWDNVGPDNAIFGGGTGTPGSFYNVDLASPITVQNIVLREVGGDAQYSISTFSGGTLNLLGNIIKEGNDGSLNYFANTTLTANHVITMRDTPGDVPEFLFNGFLSGTGGVTIDNGPYEAWGTAAFNQANTYTGVTNINKGRLLLTNPEGLGAATGASSGTVIADQGTLALWGAGTPATGGFTVNEPIRITRSQYSEAGGEFGRYDGAIQSNGDASGVNASIHNTIAGPVVLDTVDGRIQVNGGVNSLTISSNITQVGTAKLSKSGSGVLFLTGNNTYTGGTASRGGTVAFTTDANIGGPTAPMFFDGGYFRVPATWTNFGAHPIDNTAFGGGLDTPGPTQVFVVSQDLTGTNFNKRGVGTVNLNGTNVFSDNNFTDLGTVNVNGNTTARAIRIRNGTVNVNSGGSYTTTGQWTSIGNDNGENGTLSVNGTGILRAGWNPTATPPAPAAQDFNVSDNANTTGTFNVRDQAVAEIYGNFFVAKNANTNATVNISNTASVTHRNGGVIIGRGNTAVGTFNMSGGTYDGTGNVEIGDDAGGTGTMNITGGTFTTTGEYWVGNENGTGTLNLGVGTLNVNNWFVVGRFGAGGTLNFTGGTINKAGGGNTEIDVQGGAASTATMSGTAAFNANTGDFRVAVAGGGNGTLLVKDSAQVNVAAGQTWIGNSGATGVVTIQDSGSLTYNNWFAIGRGGGTNGTLNLSGNATVTKASGTGNHAIIGAGGAGTLNQTGGTFTNTVSQTWIAENGTAGTWNLSGGTANLGELQVGRTGSGAAVLNVSGTGSLTSTDIQFGQAQTVTGTINLDGGTITAGKIRSGAGTGTDTFNLNGGLLKAGASDVAWFQGLAAANVKAGGAKIDSNGFDVTANQVLAHDAALGATPDGGLVKSGTGSLTLGAANTYTGNTNVTGGTLVVGNVKALGTGTLAVANGATARLQPALPTAVSLPAPLGMTASGPTGGTLDITNNSMALRHADQSAAFAGHTTVNSLTRNAFHDFAWDQPGITSSNVKADVTAGIPAAVGILLNNDGGGNPLFYGNGTDLPLFDGLAVDSNSVLVKDTLLGDGDLNGVVDTVDFALFQAGYTNSAPYVGFAFGDYDYNGVVDTVDFGLFQAGYQYSQANPPAPEMVAFATEHGLPLVAAVVPEPAAFGLLALAGGTGLLARRRRSARSDA